MESEKNINNGEPYGRVLRRYDRAPTVSLRYCGYDVSLKSSPHELEGKVALTIFFPPGKDAAADRARKLGWVDETEKWNLQYKDSTTHWSNLGWHEFRKYAGDLGIDLSGKREDIEKRLIEFESEK